jgi:hypothetical protein
MPRLGYFESSRTRLYGTCGDVRAAGDFAAVHQWPLLSRFGALLMHLGHTAVLRRFWVEPSRFCGRVGPEAPRRSNQHGFGVGFELRWNPSWGPAYQVGWDTLLVHDSDARWREPEWEPWTPLGEGKHSRT